MVQSQTVSASRGLRGEITVPGDKSISHRSVMFGSLAKGVTRVSGFLQGEDNLSTVKAFRAMGVTIDQPGDGELVIHGLGVHGLQEPADVLDCGNSGTTIRLMSGLLAGQSFFSVLTGDQYLRKRPMGRIVAPLAGMGASIRGRQQGQYAPLAIDGQQLKATSYQSPVASAQVKSAVLLAGLYADGVTTVYEPHLSRDHSERMLRHFGVEVTSFDGGVSLAGGQELTARDLLVPGDISSAAFFMVAGLIVPDSELLIKNVGINPTRCGVIDILKKMNGSIELVNEREMAGEPVADLLVKSSDLKGIEIGGEDVPRAIDEFPVISVAAACAEGTTVIRDAKELRVKETDRIAAMADVLSTFGVTVTTAEDGMTVQGAERLQGGRVNSCGDHRIAMSSAIAALRADGDVVIEDTQCTATSFPNFWQLLGTVTV
ncbi:3-phosphoshikimate 1-carboxyvinyltransferase [Desulfuromonas acetoxidans]|uniref:3-phosphoshikimate 1-carboxyvinyltransferase n=1 Tax=Desulfuromonas acetoxidans TaxID=891 RepID=UPI00292EB6E5|nr:3-phosphoshikimate 1-carboxyvinyltransferase [Desulfuromonas acetoxidans]